jgi:hypothetical protein
MQKGSIRKKAEDIERRRLGEQREEPRGSEGTRLGRGEPPLPCGGLSPVAGGRGVDSRCSWGQGMQTGMKLRDRVGAGPREQRIGVVFEVTELRRNHYCGQRGALLSVLFQD